MTHLTLLLSRSKNAYLFLVIYFLPTFHLNILVNFEQKKMESEISELLDAAERTMGLYFSYDINLTLK